MLQKLLLASSLLLSIPLAHAENIALLIGVGNYKSNAVVPLEGPPNDVAELKKALITQMGFKEKNIKTLVDSQATHSNILAALENLNTISKTGDSVFIYFSGHGTSINDPKFASFASVLPHLSGAYVPYDIDATNKNPKQEDVKNNLIVGRWHLQPILKKLEQGRTVFVMMDSCFSGNAVRSLARTEGKKQLNTPFSSIPITDNSDEAKYPYKNVVFLSAAGDAEFAVDISNSQAGVGNVTFDNKAHGALTNAFLEVLHGKTDVDVNKDKKITYKELADGLKDSLLRKENKQQTPQLLPDVQQDVNQIVTRSIFKASSVSNGAVFTIVDSVIYVDNQAKLSEVNSLAGIGIETKVNDIVDFKVTRNGSGYNLSTGANDIILEKASPTLITQRLQAEIWVKNLLKPLKKSANLRVETSGYNGNNFVDGQKFVFQISNTEDSYLLILNINSHGQVSILYPYNNSELAMLAANKPVSIPSGKTPDDFIVVEPPFGLEKVVVIAMPKSIDLSLVKPLNKTSIGHQHLQAVQQMITSQPSSTWSVLDFRTYPKTGK